jgi:sarcosine oxidase subunit beta
VAQRRVVIIGGGAVGLSTALHLTKMQADLDVVVLEADHVGSGSSSRSIGVVETQYVGEFDIAVRAYGRQFCDDLAENHGLRFVRTGYVRLASKESDFADYELSLKRQADCGVTDAQVLEAKEVEALIPQISMAGRLGGLYGPSDGFLDGHLFCSLMTELIVENGGKVRQNTKVLGINSLANGDFEIETTQGTFLADEVVNAAGGWAGKIGDLLGTPVPLVPQLHSAALIQMGAPLANMIPMVMDYVPGSGKPGLYFRYERPDQLVAGLHIEEAINSASDPDTYSETGTPEFIEELAELISERLPGLPEGGISRAWSGIYPLTTDRSPIVGSHPNNPRVKCALGAGGNGIQLAPAIGRAVAEEIVTGNLASLPADNPWTAARLSG